MQFDMSSSCFIQIENNQRSAKETQNKIKTKIELKNKTKLFVKSLGFKQETTKKSVKQKSK